MLSFFFQDTKSHEVAAHNLLAAKRNRYLLKGVFNGFITELFTAAFLQNIVTEGSQQFSTRTARDTLVTEDLKGFFKCL
jgi:hypothetical protein